MIPLARPFRFRPRPWPTLLAGGLIALCIGLGQWQLDKAQARAAAQARLDAAAGDAPIEIGSAPLVNPAALHLQPVQARGHYDAAGQILIDNRVLHERSGFHVLTPLVIAGGDTRVLVNRGWIAAPADRREAIDAPVPAGEIGVVGTATLPAKFFTLAADTAPAGGNAIWQNLDLERYRAAVRAPVQPLVILLAPAAPGGFARDWPRPDAGHERNRAYAWQWFGFAATALAIWAVFAFRRGDGDEPAAAPPGTPAPAAPRRRLTLLWLLLALFALPLTVVAALALADWRPAKSGSHGELVAGPPLSLTALRAGDGAPLPVATLAGRWTLVVATAGACNSACRLMLEQTQRLHAALARNAPRLRRLWLTPDPAADPALPAIRAAFPDLVVAAGSDAQWRALNAAIPVDSARVFVIDPAGRPVLRYADPFDARGALRDVERLLRFSWIG